MGLANINFHKIKRNNRSIYGLDIGVEVGEELRSMVHKKRNTKCFGVETVGRLERSPPKIGVIVLWLIAAQEANVNYPRRDARKPPPTLKSVCVQLGFRERKERERYQNYECERMYLQNSTSGVFIEVLLI